MTTAEAQRDYYSKSNPELAAIPFFRPFNNPALLNAQSGSEAARVDHPHVLGYEIPALSYAAGGTEMTQLTRIDKFDMNTHMQDWPQERDDNSSNNKIRWRHSDFKDVAYRYTHPVFDQMVTTGNLK